MKVQDRIEIVKLCKRKNTNPPYIDDLRGIESCVPYGSRTRVAGMKILSPRPLDEGDFSWFRVCCFGFHVV
jgi:hypothetical protein